MSAHPVRSGVASPESAVRVSSPLNPSSSPNSSGAATPTKSPPLPLGTQGRPRGHSTSTIHQNTSATSTLANPLSRVTSEPAVQFSPTLTVSDYDHDDILRSSFRNRSRSSFGSRSRSPKQDAVKGQQIPPGERPSSWWSKDSDLIPRPWKDSPKRKNTVPTEQTEGWVHTRERVAKAAVSVLGTAGDVAHEVLLTSVDLLEFVPVMGLSVAAKTLLNIWDAVQLVDTNRLACLRLTERCAEILLAVRAEVKEAGDSVGDELAMPVARLDDAFNDVHNFLQKQVHRPFLKRYLKRDEILKQIEGCDQGLTEALGMFSISIQIRILKEVQKAEVQRQADTKALLGSLLGSRSTIPMSTSNTQTSMSNAPPLSDIGIGLTGLPPSSSHKSLSAENLYSSMSTILQSAEIHRLQTLPGIANLDAALSLPSPSTLLPSEILPTLQNLHSMQNSVDAAHDMADLRGLMRAALSTSSDVEMLHVLQIGKEEMPEALKTLQRALERVKEKAAVADATAGAGVEERERPVRRVSAKRVVLGKGGRNRSKTIVSVQDSESSQSGGSGDSWGRDTLDQEFLETGIEALRRMSNGVETTLPSWTITRFECDREQKIGIGFFSDVYKGKWRGRAVAIKVLADSTPRDLFVQEISIWKTLRHPHVLELYGASSASGDPPWFFVSPYLKNGSLVEYLKRHSGGVGLGYGMDITAGAGAGHQAVGSGGIPIRGRTATFPAWRNGSPGGSPRPEGALGRRGRSPDEPVPREADSYRFMQEIAKGMEYLHENGVLHGDLKAANVLVDDRLRCVISDFGQSEMKSEAYRISGTQPPHGTLRWQAPELMSGQSQLTAEMDVYAYAILCIEILGKGRMPWALLDDDAVRHFVLKENSRPEIPVNTRFNTSALRELLRVCWHQDPANRPSFVTIVKDVRAMRKSMGQVEEVYSPVVPEVPEMWEDYHPRPSPDMRPGPLPIPFGTPPRDPTTDLLAGSPDSHADANSFRTAREKSHSPPKPSHFSHPEETVASSQIRMPVPVFYTPSAQSSRASSLFTHTPSTQSEENLNLVNYEGYDSPPPADERLAEIRNERRYRMLLNHPFHPSLTLPLWGPSPVSLGAVGYLSKPSGSFITLFNALTPQKSPIPDVRNLPSVHGYGRVSAGSQRQDKRNAAQRGLDAFVGLLTFRSRGDGPISRSVGRRYSFPLRAGHKTAYMCAETTIYRYAENLEAPKKWFKANVDTIMRIFGAEHRIQKEDLFLVIGTLSSRDYALFVSHAHPDGQVHFNVFSSPRTNQPWGTFTTDTEVSPELGGPSYDEPSTVNPLTASKVSNNGGPYDTVLIAKLRFKPDALEPTSL